MSALISDRIPCSATQSHAHLDYLKNNSHVKQPVSLMEKCAWPLENAKVIGVGNIGRLLTYFTNLGFAYSQSLYGTPKFLVAQAVEVLTNLNYCHHPDMADMIQKLHRYKYQFAGPSSDPKVTIAELPSGIIILDGNKTAIAAFLYALETNQRGFDLPVFYLAPPTSAVATSTGSSA